MNSNNGVNNGTNVHYFSSSNASASAATPTSTSPSAKDGRKYINVNNEYGTHEFVDGDSWNNVHYGSKKNVTFNFECK